MGEKGRNFPDLYKINTLEGSLKLFDKPCLLEELDISLELLRRKRETEEGHFRRLKSADKDLQKLSLTYHPDKAIREKKSDQEVENAQNMQTALNATRTVLKALTEEFLKDLDAHYKYEFFAKLDINTLINEKQIDLEINNVLCKISRLSEIKRVNIIGEIRKFLLQCRTCLLCFHSDNKHDFRRHRDNGLHHLHKCIEGYEILLNECVLIMEECGAEEGNTRTVIQNICKQSEDEYKILQNLQRVAKRSLGGPFEVFPISIPIYNDCMNLTEYKSVVPQEREYLVLPFLLYVDVLLMCSVIVDKKSGWTKLKTKIGETFDYITGYNWEEPIIFFEEPALLNAYYLASYFNSKNHYKKEVQSILKEKDPSKSENDNIREAFKQTVGEIQQLLAKQFDIDSYKEGKSNREQFNERMFELNDSVAKFKEMEKNLLEKFKLFEQETNEIRKESSEIFEKIGEESQENITKCTIENVNETITSHQTEITGNGMCIQQTNPHENENYSDVKDNYIESKSVTNNEDQHCTTEEHGRKLEENEKNIHLRSNSEPMIHDLGSSNQTTQTSNDLRHIFSSSCVFKVQKEQMNFQMSGLVSDETSRILPNIYLGFGENAGEKSSDAVVSSKQQDAVPLDDWAII